MSAAQFLLCPDEPTALAADASICAHLQQVDGNRGSRWSGAQVRDDGTYGIVWEPQLEKIWPALQAKLPVTLAKDAKSLPLDTATIDAQTKKSNWAEKPAAAPILLNAEVAESAETKP